MIKAINNSDENIYIQSATLNGNPFNASKLKFKEVVKGGELIYYMGVLPKGKGQPQ